MPNAWLRSGDAEIVEKRLGVSYYSFVSSVLEQHFHEKEVEFKRTTGSAYYLPNGYLNYEGPLYLFHVYRPMMQGIIPFTGEIPAIKELLCTKSIVIYSGDVQKSPKDEELGDTFIKNVIHQFKSEGIDLVVWRYYKFVQMMDGAYDHAIEDAVYRTNLLNKYLDYDEPVVKSVIEKNQNAIINLSKALQNDRLCLVLGAGVSAASKIPMWADIVSEFMGILVEKSFTEQNYSPSKEQMIALSKNLYRINNSSPLTKMRYIKNGFTNKEYLDILHNILYGNGEDLKSDTDLLYAIANLCEPLGGYSWARVKRIITYNFDGLLEKCFDELRIRYNIVCNGEQRYKDNNLTIYHVHGYLPRNRHEPGSDIIFSEEDYHRLYSDPYNWSNVVQLDCFRENICLFIGCSMTDPNIRRLLDASKSSSNTHYCIMMRNSKNSDIGSFARELINRYKEIDEQLTTNFYNSIGVEIVWVDSFDEIPILLKGIDKKAHL